MKRESHAMLAHQTKQVTFLLPKIGTQNETLDSDIKEGCQVASHSGCGHSFVIHLFIKCCENLVWRVSSLISFGVNSTSCVWFWQYNTVFLSLAFSVLTLLLKPQRGRISIVLNFNDSLSYFFLYTSLFFFFFL